MRHGKTNRKFGRETKQRKALLKSLAVSLIARDKIKTTYAKAKELRPFVEKMVTESKTNTLATRRHLSKYVDTASVKKLLTVLGPKFASRPGGYTRIVRLPTRTSDGSQMGIIEFVE